MATDPNLIASFMSRWQTPQVAIPDPLERFAKLQSLKNGIAQAALQQQQLQTGALALKQQQQAFNDQQQMDAAWKGAITTDANGNVIYDRAKVLNAVPGHLAPGITKTFAEMDKADTDAKKAKAEATDAQANSIGSALLGVKDHNYDPAFFDAVLTHAAGIGQIDPRQAAVFRAQLGPNPTPEAIKAAIDPYLAAPAVQKLENERGATAASQKTAETGANKLQDERIERALNAAAGATSQDELNAARYEAIKLGASPAQVNSIPMQFTPEVMAAYTRSRLNPEQKTQADIAQINAERGQAAQQETARHNRAEERHALVQESIEATRNALTQSAARGDRSYQAATHELDQLGKPVTDAVQRLGRLQDTLAQNSPQADALVAPELLSVMAGGSGSGLRMNEAEIARIVGGRSKWEDLKAAVNKWQLDPSKATSITPEQRQEIRNLTKTVSDKIYAKQTALDAAYKAVAGAQDVNEHRQAVLAARQAISNVDAGGAHPGGAGGGTLPARLSQADVGKIYTNKAGKPIKITAVNPADPTQFKADEVQ